ncbi:hypothetical protein [Phormidium nigroviride]
MKPRIFVFSLLILSLIVVTVKAEPNCDKPNPFYSWGLRSNPPRCEGLNDKEPTGGKPLEFLSLVIRRLSQKELEQSKTIFLEVPEVQDAEITYCKMIGESSNFGSDYLLNRFTIPENNKFEWPSNVLKEALKNSQIPIKNLYPKAEARLLLNNKKFYLPVTLGPGDNPGKYEFVWASTESFSITRIEIYKSGKKEPIYVKPFNQNYPDHPLFIFTWNGKDQDAKEAGIGTYRIDFVGKRDGKSLNESYLFYHDPKLLGEN